MPRFPLTLMEQYLFAEDKRAYPCWIFIRFRFRGTIQREFLHQAWRETVRRHTTLHSVVRPDSRGRLGWEPVPSGHEPQFIWERGTEVAWTVAWTPIDLSREPGVRLVVAEGDGRCEISLEGHHAVFDGVGAFAVAHDLFLLYARKLGATGELPEWRPELFPKRNHFGLGWWGRLKLAPIQMLGLAFAWQMERRTVAKLAPHEVFDFNSPPPVGFPHVLHQNLSATDLTRLRAVAKHHDVSLNDLLIRDLQAAIGVWRMREGIGEPDDWIAIGVPVGLRRSSDRLLSAANVIGLVVIDRRMKSLHNRPRLLRRAREDMDLVKRHKLGYTFLVMLALWRWRRGGIARYSNTPRCRATAVLTNLGQPFSRSPLLDASKRLTIPGAVMDEYTMVAPCRPGTAASFAVAIYGNRLHVDLHHHPRAMNDRQAETLLGTFFEQLIVSANEPLTSPPATTPGMMTAQKTQGLS